MSIADNKSIVLQAYAAFDRGDIEIGKALIAPDITGWVMGSQELKGAEAFFKYATIMAIAFPDGYHSFREIVVEENKVVTWGEFIATHQGEFLGIKPTGKKVNFTVVHIDRLSSGQIVEHWGIADRLTLMGQLNASSRF